MSSFSFHPTRPPHLCTFQTFIFDSFYVLLDRRPGPHGFESLKFRLSRQEMLEQTNIISIFPVTEIVSYGSRDYPKPAVEVVSSFSETRKPVASVRSSRCAAIPNCLKSLSSPMTRNCTITWSRRMRLRMRRRSFASYWSSRALTGSGVRPDFTCSVCLAYPCMNGNSAKRNVISRALPVCSFLICGEHSWLIGHLYLRRTCSASSKLGLTVRVTKLGLKTLVGAYKSSLSASLQVW